MRRPKKLIASGWDMMYNDRLQEYAGEMEKRPFDGAVLGVKGQDDDEAVVELRFAFKDEKWHLRWFSGAVAQFRAIKFRRFTDNFILFNAKPDVVDWFNDDGWRNIVEHWYIAARVAKESRFKGILFDPEPNSPQSAPFRYAVQPCRDQYSFAEYYAKARERGKEVMEVIRETYPDITLFCYFMNSANAKATGCVSPLPALPALGPSYDLYPAFIDGWLAALPPSATLVDGCETAYGFDSVQEYLEAGTTIRGACQELVSPENRTKYRAQVQVSFGVYLDAYRNPPDTPFHSGEWIASGRDRLRENVGTALRVADEYVWIYGEQCRWWPTDNQDVGEETWPEALPGCEEVLRYVRDPVGYAREQIAKLKESEEFVNLIHNGDFGQGQPNGLPANWLSTVSPPSVAWDNQKGNEDPGSARMSGVTNGCVHQYYGPVEPGERYAVRAFRTLRGNGIAFIRVRWWDSELGWVLEHLDPLIFCPGPRGEWSELFGVVQIPHGADNLVIQLSVRDQPSTDDEVWFDDVEVCKIV
jgi:hypothetical protein